MNRTIGQNKELFMLISKLHIDDDARHDIIEQFTDGRSRSSKDLTYKEAEAMIEFLRSMATDLVRTKSEAANKMRRKIFSICHELGWEDSGGYVDKTRLNAFLMKSGYLKKPLMDYTYQELPKLLTQFENILKSSYGKESKN